MLLKPHNLRYTLDGYYTCGMQFVASQLKQTYLQEQQPVLNHDQVLFAKFH